MSTQGERTDTVLAHDRTRPVNSPVQRCPNCIIRIYPNPVVVCICPGGCGQQPMTWEGSFSGAHQCAWRTDHPNIATVSDTGLDTIVRGVAVGETRVTATYTSPNGPCSDTVPVFVLRVDLELRNRGPIVPAPENEDYARECHATGGIDLLGPLPMGQGRWERPREAYVTSLMVVGTILPQSATVLATFRWRRLLTRRSWNIRRTTDGSRWIVSLRDDSGFQANDTGTENFNDATPSSTGRIYIHDSTGIFPGNDRQDRVGDFIYSEKAFLYRVERRLADRWITCAELDVGQVILARRQAMTGDVPADWDGRENSTAVRRLEVGITEPKVRSIVGGTLPIQIEPGAIG
jgi:hypothetical protein